MERRLAAILAVDVVGYSRLMAADEGGTHARLKALRREFVEPRIAAHHGRVVKLMGDGALVEFASVVDAVTCAVEIQRETAERSLDAPGQPQLQLRIGINLGDVIHDEDDIYGDGVNIAARLEALADPGGICVSDVVHSQVRGRTEVTFEPRGRQAVKNIPDPIEVWTWSPGPGAPASPSGPLDLPDEPSLAVLPFLNLTADPAQEALADGFTEDLITAISRAGTLLVVARNSTFSYKGRATDVTRIASELGVRYVLEGSIRQLADRFRVNAQLIDARNGHHIWAEAYDGDRASFSNDQDDVVRSIAASVQTQIIVHRGKVPPRPDRDAPNVDELLSHAWGGVYQLTPKALRETQRLAETAIDLSPDYDRAHQTLAVALFHLTYLGYVDDWEDTIRRACRAAERAIELFESSEQSHWILGLVLMMMRDHEGAVAELERAIEINPNFSLGYGSLGTVLAWGGRSEEAIANNDIALRLNPRDPGNFFRFFCHALAHFTAGRHDDAVTWATRAIRAKRVFRIPYLVRIAALALGDQLERARASAEDMKAHVPEVTRGYVDKLPFIRAQDHEALVRGLELASLLR
jgi:adenylate cyclase